MTGEPGFVGSTCDGSSAAEAIGRVCVCTETRGRPCDVRVAVESVVDRKRQCLLTVRTDVHSRPVALTKSEPKLEDA
jgi:hypothetical protein